jgi:hypothetical protein
MAWAVPDSELAIDSAYGLVPPDAKASVFCVLKDYLSFPVRRESIWEKLLPGIDRIRIAC